ncbi:tRNA (N(6)-L-threonylcarbamoyladenosine(37)-C(2))-methylthiotransferase MtaB [bacterium]|nr:tRNA (N(6)-L-threonylcarbamoyladenosine(37)-C(2))-methylthiotransferase MtaB [bacterium]
MSQAIKIAIKTLGCKLNQYESMGMQEKLEATGYIIVGHREKADIYIINSCTVTGKTDRRSRHAARQVLKWNPDALIIVTGCGAQRDFQEFSDIPRIRAIIGNREKNHIDEYVKRVISDEPLIIAVSSLSKAPFEKLSISRFRNYTRAFLKIQEGCNRKCSYCIIPAVRGHSRSQSPDKILDEIHVLVNRGFKEIVLTGIDLGTYGLDLTPKTNLTSLLGKIEVISDLERVRLSSIEPMEFTTELISKITSSKKICRHFHIPLQSGTDTVLQRMNRSYTRDNFAEIVLSLKKHSPDACIGSDVITAFPGETNSEFQDTYQFLDQLPISYLHVFTYSVRENTPAAKFPEHIHPETARERSHALRELSKKKKLSFRQHMIGKIIPAIILGSKDSETGYPISLSDNYIQILVEGNAASKGSIINIEITRNDSLRCFGKISNQ